MEDPEMTDALGRTMAQRNVDMGARYPYDGDRPLMDRAHAAARGILYDLCDRGGIKHGFDDVDDEIRAEIVDTISATIREAMARPSDAENPVIERTARAIAEAAGWRFLGYCITESTDPRAVEFVAMARAARRT